MKKITTEVMINDTFVTAPRPSRPSRNLRVHSLHNGYAVCGVYSDLRQKKAKKLTVISADRLNRKQGFMTPAEARKATRKQVLRPAPAAAW